jgi:hypothetical protein
VARYQPMEVAQPAQDKKVTGDFHLHTELRYLFGWLRKEAISNFSAFYIDTERPFGMRIFQNSDLKNENESTTKPLWSAGAYEIRSTLPIPRQKSHWLSW